MPRTPKPKLPEVLTPTSPAELAQSLTSLPQGGLRALAASSTVIALSIASAFYDTHNTSSDGATVRGRDAGWQVAYGAAKMAVEVAKETSDMFLPLKAVAGAISVLIKSYDVGAFPVASTPCPNLLLVPANTRECGDCEGDRAEGAVAVWCACLSCKQG